jgi:adenosylcobinamide-GDP ribazoletransferase
MSERPPEGSATVADGVRFAFGTLTVLPVSVGRWDRAAGRGGMLCAPAVGLVVGLLAGAAGAAVVWLGGPPALAGVAAVAVPAVLTRGLHLDGLADTADGLGSGKPADEALRIMKQSDIGPFGVLTLVLVLLAQAAALAGRYGHGGARGLVAAAVAGCVGRAAMTLACRVGIPPARPDGLGVTVAASVPVRAAWAVGAGCVLVAIAAAWGLTGAGPAGEAWYAVAAAAGLGAGWLLLRRCVTRLGGVTGDVFGAVCETAVTAVLVVLALG